MYLTFLEIIAPIIVLLIGFRVAAWFVPKVVRLIERDCREVEREVTGEEKGTVLKMGQNNSETRKDQKDKE